MWVLLMVLFVPADTVMLSQAQTYRVPLEYLKTWEECTKESQRLAADWMLSYPDTRDTWFTCSVKGLHNAL
jgi:hypothetical protein